MCTVPSIETFSTYASDVLRDVDYISYYDVLPRRVYCTHSQPSVLRDGRTLVFVQFLYNLQRNHTFVQSTTHHAYTHIRT